MKIKYQRKKSKLENVTGTDLLNWNTTSYQQNLPRSLELTLISAQKCLIEHSLMLSRKARVLQYKY